MTKPLPQGELCMAMAFNPCIILPIYNHPHYLRALVVHLQAYDCPIIMVNDGSNAECCVVIDEIGRDFSVQILTHDINQGKGQAVMTGLDFAHAQGYTHALQIDVDGQHDWADIGKFLDIAKQHPQAMVIGKPIYGADVPKKRLYGRYATHIWVWINSLSLQIKDSMCGFRVYPVGVCQQVLTKHRLRKRMGFDSEILVHLSWLGVDFVNVPTKVRYPENGISHFDVWADNVELTKMQTHLFFGMLVRLPTLIYRNIKRWQRGG